MGDNGATAKKGDWAVSLDIEKTNMQVGLDEHMKSVIPTPRSHCAVSGKNDLHAPTGPATGKIHARLSLKVLSLCLIHERAGPSVGGERTTQLSG